MKTYSDPVPKAEQATANHRSAHSPRLDAVASQSPEYANLQSLQRMADESPVTAPQANLQKLADSGNTQQVRSAGDNGLPIALKSGIESLSGYSMDDVKVHYNSSEPAIVQAKAFAQGTNIHVAPGEEKHLAHEAWHVVQQKQGRVKPSTQFKTDVAINDDEGLEREADVMGAKALQMATNDQAEPVQRMIHIPTTGMLAPIQRRKIGKFGMEAEVLKERFKMIALNDRPEAQILSDPDVCFEEFALGSLSGGVDVTLDNELDHETTITKERSFTVEFVGKAVDAIAGEPEDLEKMELAWTRAAQFWKTNMLGARKVIGMVGEAVDWFEQNPHWKGPQFEKYAENRNVDAPEGEHRLFWDGPGFFTYIDARTPDPMVSMQMTAGSTLTSLDAMRLATSHVLAGNAAPSKEQLALAREVQDFGGDGKQPEAWALLKILRSYHQQSFDEWLKRNQPGKVPPAKRYQKEYIAMMVRTSLASVFDGMTGPGRQAFIGWVREYGEHGTGPIAEELIGNPMAGFFAAPTKKEPQSNTISIAEVLVSIINRHLPEEDQDNLGPGDAFTQVGPAPLEGFGEINEGRPDQLAKYGLNNASEMMRGVTGLIAENRAAKIRPLSEVPEVFRQLVAALRVVEDS